MHDQQQLRSTQDQHLDVMSEGLTRLKDVSHAIADELDEHNRLLNDSIRFSRVLNGVLTGG